MIIGYCWRRVFVWKIAFVHLSGSAASFVKKPHDRIQIYFKHTIVICFTNIFFIKFFSFFFFKVAHFRVQYNPSTRVLAERERLFRVTRFEFEGMCLIDLPFFLSLSIVLIMNSLLWSISILIFEKASPFLSALLYCCSWWLTQNSFFFFS